MGEVANEYFTSVFAKEKVMGHGEIREILLIFESGLILRSRRCLISSNH